MKSTGAWSSNELQRIDCMKKYQASSLSIDCQATYDAPLFWLNLFITNTEIKVRLGEYYICTSILFGLGI